MSLSHQRRLVIFNWIPSDNKSFQVSMALLSIHADFYDVVVWIISILSLISNSHSLFSRPLVIVPNTPTSIGVIVTLVFHSFSVLWQGPNICLISYKWKNKINKTDRFIMNNKSVQYNNRAAKKLQFKKCCLHNQMYKLQRNLYTMHTNKYIHRLAEKLLWYPTCGL